MFYTFFHARFTIPFVQISITPAFPFSFSLPQLQSPKTKSYSLFPKLKPHPQSHFSRIETLISTTKRSIEAFPKIHFLISFKLIRFLFPIQILLIRFTIVFKLIRFSFAGFSLSLTGFQGCDGSILLDDTSNFTGEKTANPNRNSARGFEMIDKIKSAVEKVCPGAVSCADILAIAARDSVEILGGPTWDVKLGRRDARTASKSAANNGIPAPTSSLNQLISRFNALGLSTKDLVALSGGHTIGQTRCTTFRDHIYNDSNIDTSFARTRQSGCPKTSGSGDNNLAPLDLATPTSFDNHYFKNLVASKGLLHSDQQLFNGGSTDSTVHEYSLYPSSFSSDFVTAMIKMGDISPLTGSNGEIRKNCRSVN